MRLYLVHDENYCYRVVVQANDEKEAIKKLHKWFEETKQNGEFFISNKVKWIADLCDNDKILE